jgi:hypothetical protein
VRDNRIKRGFIYRLTNRYAPPKAMLAVAFLVSLASCPAPAAAERPFGSLDRDQSAYALGSFAMNIIFVESNGVVDTNQENWTPEQLTNMHVEIGQTAAYWESLTAAYHPNAQLDITVNYVNGGVPLETRYEPINRPGVSSSPLWMNDVMDTLGYSNANSNTNTRDFNNAQRDLLGTHWAATVYVVNDAVDSNHKFTDNYFAFSIYGGPYVVTTYNNNGWGVDRYDRVLSHELGHVFFALDEYYSSGSRTTDRSGYLNGSNGNAERNGVGARVTPPQPDALMLNITLDPSEFTSVQVGHVDTDNDTIPDILDTIPNFFGSDAASDADAGIFSFSGSGSVRPKANLNPKVWAESGARMTINTIDGGSYNLDGLGWIDFPAADGAWGDYSESIELDLLGLDVGLHTIDLRITNSVGNHSAVDSYELFVTPEPGTLGIVCLGLLGCLRRRRKTNRPT